MESKSCSCSSSSCASDGCCRRPLSARIARIAAENGTSAESARGNVTSDTPINGTTPASPRQTADSVIKLAIVRETERHSDLRGSVMETYRESWFPEVPPVKQLVQSISRPQTLRGMHLHRTQWDVWRFMGGDALVRLYDPRSGRNEFLRGDESNVIAIPPGIAHGFYTEHGCTLVYALTAEYTGDDEFGFYPFDGMTLATPWPRSHDNLKMSERDLRAPRLAEFLLSN